MNAAKVRLPSLQEVLQWNVGKAMLADLAELSVNRWVAGLCTKFRKCCSGQLVVHTTHGSQLRQRLDCKTKWNDDDDDEEDKIYEQIVGLHANNTDGLLFLPMKFKNIQSFSQVILVISNDQSFWSNKKKERGKKKKHQKCINCEAKLQRRSRPRLRPPRRLQNSSLIALQGHILLVCVNSDNPKNTNLTPTILQLTDCTKTRDLPLLLITSIHFVWILSLSLLRFLFLHENRCIWGGAAWR